LKCSHPGLKEKAQEWIGWAKGYVERVDPVKRGFEIPEREEFDSL
jgi:hypothetical protein